MRFALASPAPAPLRKRGAIDRGLDMINLVGGVRVRGRVLPSDPAARLRARARSLMTTCDRLLEIHDVQVELLGQLPLSEGPMVVVANHLSYLDPILLARLLPATPIAKQEVGDWPVLGAAVAALGALFVDRTSVESRTRALRGAFQSLCAGASVINFPEGSTTDGRDLLPFHRGIFGIAIKAGVPIVPVRIDYPDPRMTWTADASFLPHYLRVLRMPSIEAKIWVGDPIQPSPTRRPEELAERARAVIKDRGDRR